MIQNDKYMREGMPGVSYEQKIALLTRALRNLFGITQADLATLSNTSRPTISRLEKLSGDRLARLDTLERILGVFRERGVEVTFDGEDIVLRLTHDTLRTAVKSVRGEDNH
jgi:transcriptional regulator with XRE-family HTH domain